MRQKSVLCADDDDAREAPAAGDGAGRSRRGWTRLAALAAALAVIAALVAVIVTRDGGGDEATTKPSTTTAPETSAAAPGSTTPAAATTSPPAGQRSALDALGPFLAAAATMDGRLHTAAAAIDGAGPPFTTVSAGVAGTVRAADIDAVAAEIPAGLPTPLLRRTILVYSDVASRRAAMQGFAFPHTVETVPNPPGDVTGEDLAAELRNGHAAAVRFDDDLAALRALATGTAPVTIAAPSSRAAAETRLHIALVNEANTGCDSRGGAIFTDLAPITWQSDNRGTIDRIAFHVSPGAGGQWDVRLNAC